MNAGDLHFYMRHSFKAAPPAELSPRKPTKTHAKSEAQKDAQSNGDSHRRKANGKAEHLNGHANHDKLPVANGMNGHSCSHQLGGNSWKAVTEEALRKLQGISTDARPSSASPAVSSASVTGLSRSASFASLDSQPHLEGTAHKGGSLVSFVEGSRILQAASLTQSCHCFIRASLNTRQTHTLMASNLLTQMMLSIIGYDE